MPSSMRLDKERNTTSTPEGQAGVLVVHKHHQLVRGSHWLELAKNMNLKWRSFPPRLAHRDHISSENSVVSLASSG